MNKFIAFAAIAAIGIRAQAQSTLSGQISFTGLTWSDGSTSSGYFDYTYDSTSDSLLSITAVDINTQAGSGIPSFQLYYSIAGEPDNAQAGQDYNNSSQQKYEAYFEDTATRKDQIFLDWTGVGSSAMLVSTTPGNFASISANGGSTVYGATSLGTVVATPEPSSLALIGLGAAALVVARRKK